LIGSLDLFEWFVESSRSESSSKRDVFISLLNEEREPVFTWRLKNAWVSSYSCNNLKASSSDIAIESIELAHEGLSAE
jgi:phage tail-like protein